MKTTKKIALIIIAIPVLCIVIGVIFFNLILPKVREIIDLPNYKSLVKQVENTPDVVKVMADCGDVKLQALSRDWVYKKEAYALGDPYERPRIEMSDLLEGYVDNQKYFSVDATRQIHTSNAVFTRQEGIPYYFESESIYMLLPKKEVTMIDYSKFSLQFRFPNKKAAQENDIAIKKIANCYVKNKVALDKELNITSQAITSSFEGGTYSKAIKTYRCESGTTLLFDEYYSIVFIPEKNSEKRDIFGKFDNGGIYIPASSESAQPFEQLKLCVNEDGKSLGQFIESRFQHVHWLVAD